MLYYQIAVRLRKRYFEVWLVVRPLPSNQIRIALYYIRFLRITFALANAPRIDILKKFCQSLKGNPGYIIWLVRRQQPVAASKPQAIPCPTQEALVTRSHVAARTERVLGLPMHTRQEPRALIR